MKKTSIKNKIYLYSHRDFAVNSNAVASVYGSIWKKVYIENFPIYISLKKST